MADLIAGAPGGPVLVSKRIDMSGDGLRRRRVNPVQSRPSESAPWSRPGGASTVHRNPGSIAEAETHHVPGSPPSSFVKSPAAPKKYTPEEMALRTAPNPVVLQGPGAFDPAAAVAPKPPTTPAFDPAANEAGRKAFFAATGNKYTPPKP